LEEPAAFIFRDPEEGGRRWHHISEFSVLFIVSALRTPNLTSFISSLLKLALFSFRAVKIAFDGTLLDTRHFGFLAICLVQRWPN
jgi:hypothetical protein